MKNKMYSGGQDCEGPIQSNGKSTLMRSACEVGGANKRGRERLESQGSRVHSWSLFFITIEVQASPEISFRH